MPRTRLRPAMPLLVLAVLLFFVSCSTNRQHVRKELQQQELLTETVDTYWHALRWEYYDKAAAFIETVEDRTAWWNYLLSRQGVARIGDVTVYRLELDEDLNTARVWVQYQLMLANEASVREIRAEQRWYLLEKTGWCLEITDPELTRLD